MSDQETPKLAGIADVFGSNLIPVDGSGEVCTDEGCAPAEAQTVVPDLPRIDEPDADLAVAIDEPDVAQPVEEAGPQG